MSNAFFTINLDTQAPLLTIHSPNYISNNQATTIIIESNEKLSNSGASIYVIDSQNNRIDYTFSYQLDHFIGLVDFSPFVAGMATIYATLQDDVFNSATVSRPIVIHEADELFLTLSESLDNSLTLIESHPILTLTESLDMNLELKEVEIS